MARFSDSDARGGGRSAPSFDRSGSRMRRVSAETRAASMLPVELALERGGRRDAEDRDREQGRDAGDRVVDAGRGALVRAVHGIQDRGGQGSDGDGDADAEDDEGGKNRDDVAGVGRQDREEGEARRGDGRADHQRQARAHAVGEGARGMRAARDENDQRKKGRSGRGRRVAAGLDEDEGQEEEEGGEGGVEKERQKVGRGERPVAEEAQRDHGMPRATFDGDEGRQSRRARRDSCPRRADRPIRGSAPR